MNEKQRRELHARLQKGLIGSIEDEPYKIYGDASRYGGPFRGRRTIDPLVNLALFGMKDPNAGLMTFDPTRITTQTTPPPKRSQASKSHFELEWGDFEGEGTLGHYKPYYHTIRTKHPTMQKYFTPRQSWFQPEKRGRVGISSDPNRFETTMRHELYHSALKHFRNNPSLIPDISYALKPRRKEREHLRDLLVDTEGEHKLISSVAPSAFSRDYTSGGDYEKKTPVLQQRGRAKFMEELNKVVEQQQQSFAAQRETQQKKKKYTRPR